MPRFYRHNQSGFTLIELVAVMVILAILAGVATPKYLDYRQRSIESAELGEVGAIRSAIANEMMSQHAVGAGGFLATLDSAAAGSVAASDQPFFENVLDAPVIDDWTKGDTENTYISPTGATYHYVPTTGAFLVDSDYQSYLAGLGGGAGGDDDGGDAGGGGEALSVEQLLLMTPAEIAALSDEQIGQLTAEQIAALSNELLESILERLTGEQLAQATDRQVALLSATAWALLTDGQLAGLTQSQLAARARSDEVRALTYSQFRHLDVEEIAYLTDAQIATIPSSGWLETLSVDQRAELTESQVQSLQTNLTGIALLSPEQRLLITTDQVQLLSYSQMRYLTAEQTPDLTPAQIATIPSSGWLETLTDDARAALTESQVQALQTDRTGIALLTEAQRLLITTEQTQAISYSQMRYLTPAQTPDLTPAQIATIPSSGWLETIPADARAALTQSQVQALQTNLTGIALLTESQRLLITTAQTQAISYSQMRYLTAAQAPDLTPAQIATIPSSGWLETIPADARAALTQSQVQSLQTNLTGISLLTEPQRLMITTAQTQAISYSQMQYLTAAQTPDLTPAQIATIPSSGWLETLPDSARAALTSSQVQALQTNRTGIALLTANQRTMITTSQVQAISYSQMQYLDATQTPNLTVAQMATIPSTGWFNTIGDAAVQALTQDQVLAIDDGIYAGIAARLTAEQQSWR